MISENEFTTITANLRAGHPKHPYPSIHSARMSLRFVPYAVQMRRAGFVPTHSKSWSIYSPKWIQAPPPSPAVDMAAVDRTIAVLSRFVAAWVVQSRTARSAARVREAGEQWRTAAMTPNWANLTEACERREAAARRREFASWCTMPEPQWKAIARQMIADAADIGPLIRDVLVPVWAARDRRSEVAQVWGEIVQPRLHNTQRPAQVRVARVVRNRFAIDSDSE